MVNKPVIFIGFSLEHTFEICQHFQMEQSYAIVLPPVILMPVVWHSWRYLAASIIYLFMGGLSGIPPVIIHDNPSREMIKSLKTEISTHPLRHQYNIHVKTLEINIVCHLHKTYCDELQKGASEQTGRGLTLGICR